MVIEIHQIKSFVSGGESISGTEDSMFTDPKVGKDLLSRVSQETGVSVGLETMDKFHLSPQSCAISFFKGVQGLESQGILPKMSVFLFAHAYSLKKSELASWDMDLELLSQDDYMF